MFRSVERQDRGIGVILRKILLVLAFVDCTFGRSLAYFNLTLALLLLWLLRYLSWQM